MKNSIGIIGLGFVGGTIFKWFKKKKYQLYCYDKFKKIGLLEEVSKAEIIFLCLPTPYRKNIGADLSAIEESLEYFKNQKNKIFVIKSTVPPGTTENFQKQHPQHKFLFNPEFLRARDSWKTFVNADLQIVGYTQKSKNLAKRILNLLPLGKNFTSIMSATEAEIIKFAVNSFLAMKVIFANQIYELTQKLNANYEVIKQALENEPRLGKSHFNVLYEGYRGFGGACLPKDLLSFIELYKKLKLKPELFEVVWETNLKYLKGQKLLKKLYQDWLNNKS
jgi:UDPglucose 6-dehydrogenase